MQKALEEFGVGRPATSQTDLQDHTDDVRLHKLAAVLHEQLIGAGSFVKWVGRSELAVSLSIPTVPGKRVQIVG